MKKKYIVTLTEAERPMLQAMLSRGKAAARDLQLIAPRKVPGGPIGPRARQPGRMHSIALLESRHNAFGPSGLSQSRAAGAGVSSLFRPPQGCFLLKEWEDAVY